MTKIQFSSSMRSPANGQKSVIIQHRNISYTKLKTKKHTLILSERDWETKQMM
jgi:hypothetical protein